MIIIDYKDARPIYEQVVDRIKMLILRGIVLPDDKMPSVRSLAVELSLNPNTIQRAYTELERQGYIYAVKGKGNFVADKSRLVDEYRKELFAEVKEICKNAFSVGITEDEIVQWIRGGGAYD